MPAIRDFAFNYNTAGTSTTLLVPMPDYRQNDLLLALLSTDTTAQTFSASGWVQLFSLTNVVTLGVMYKIAGASEADTTFTYTGTETANGAIISIRDVDTGLPFDFTNTASYSETNADSSQSIYTGSTTAVGQSFTGDGRVLKAVRFYLKKTGSPTGNITARIYAHTGTFGSTGTPTGAALASSTTVDSATLTTSNALYTFYFGGAASITLTNATNYFVVVEYTSGSAVNYVQVAYDGSSPSHGGNYASYTGAAWSANSGRDVPFYVYTNGFSSSTSTTRKTTCPAYTTTTNNCLILYTIAHRDNCVPSIIEGAVTQIFGKDGNSHSDGASWGFQATAGATPTVTSSCIDSANTEQQLATMAIKPPSTGATVIPGYCSADASTYLTPLPGTTAYDGDTAFAATVTTSFGATLNGATLSNGTANNRADYGINPYHAMADCQGTTTSGTWYGCRYVFTSTKSVTSKNVLLHTKPYVPADIQTTDSVTLNTAVKGVAFGLCSTNNTNYRVWHVAGANTPQGTQLQPIIVNDQNTTGRLQNTGTLAPGSINALGFMVSGKVVAPNWVFGSVWCLDTTTICGGNATEPLRIPAIVQTMATGHERMSAVQQGSKQMLLLGPLRFGDGGTNPTYLDLDATAIELPEQYNQDAKQTYYCSVDNVAGITYYAGASDTIKHHNSVISSPSKYHWNFDASTSTSATYDFDGLIVIGAGTITLQNNLTLTGITWSACDSFASAGAYLSSCAINNTVGTTAALTVSSTANMARITDTSFSNNTTGPALGLSVAGTYDFDNVTFSGNTYDIRNSVNGTNTDTYSESNQNTTQALGNGTIVGVGQSFTGDGNTLSNVQFYLSKTNSPTGNLVAKVYAHTGTFGTSSLPTGTALATSESLNVANLTGSLALNVLYFIGEGRTTGDNNITLTNTTKYVVTLEYSGGDASNYLNVGIDTTSPGHGGNFMTLTGSTWSAVSGTDACFRVRTGGIIVVNASNGSNPSQTKILHSGSPEGSTTINNAVTLEVNGVVQNTQIYILDANSNILMNTTATTLVSGNEYKATATYNYTTATAVTVRAREMGYLPFETTGSISSAGLTTTAVWLVDPNWKLVVSGINIQFTNPTTITRASGDFGTDGWLAVMGQVTVEGSNNNNGTYTIAAVGTTTLTISGATLTNEGPSAGITLTFTRRSLS